MSFFVLRQQSSVGARELADALGGRRLRRFENGRFYGTRTSPNAVAVRNGDVVVNWGGAPVQAPQGVRILNNAALRNKFEDAQILQRAGVPTVEVSRTRPTAAAPRAAADPAVAIHTELQELLEDLIEAPFARNDVYIRGVNQATETLVRLRTALGQALPRPVQTPAADWVGRLNNHVGGNDLLTPPTTPDFYVKKLALVEEYRIHSFLERSIRAGIKAPREGFATPNPWIRSYDGGWRIVYDDFKSKGKMRELAHTAVKALGLDFGAVDIGKTADGKLIVLEVNRAPGLEGGTVEAYVGAITGYANGGWAEKPKRRAA